MYTWSKLLLLVAFLCHSVCSTFAQHNTEPKIENIPFQFHQTNSEKNIAELIANDHLFQAPKSGIGSVKTEDIFWIRVDFSEIIDTLKTERWFLHTGSHMEITAYFSEGEKIVQREYSYLLGSDNLQLTQPRDGVFFSAENLIDSKYLYFKIKFYTAKKKIESLRFTLEPAVQHIFEKEYYTWPEFLKETRVYLFIGAFLFIFVFSFITYFTSKRLDFLFYSLYILCLLIYLGKSAYQINDMLISQYPLFAMWLHSVLQIFINLFYVVFAKYYLETSRNYPKLNKAIYGIGFLLLGFIIVETFLLFTLKFDAHLYLMNLHRWVMSIFAVLSFIYLLKFGKNAIAYFILIGSLAFTAGSLAMLFSADKTYMMAGSIIEVLLFGLGLNHKMKKSNEEKILLKQTVYDNQISALRAQMNPHFIFNSLSSIQHLISSNKKEAAIKYLSKFSLLMRNVLESSIEANTILANEILLLQKYIELEALRFDDAFSYNITVEPSVNLDAIEIPPFIIQPFVENAILHGLLQKMDGDRELRIHFRKEPHYLICEVEDNGVGRKFTSEKKTVMKKENISRGITITEKRLNMIGEATENYLEIIDKIDENGNSTGTLVIIKIKVD